MFSFHWSGLLAAASRGSRARKATMEVAEKWFQEQVEGRSSKLAERLSSEKREKSLK